MHCVSNAWRRSREHVLTYLVECVEKLRNQRRALAWCTKHAFETELVEVANEAICAWAEGERVSPEVPLECDDRGGEHAGPDQREGGLSARKT